MLKEPTARILKGHIVNVHSRGLPMIATVIMGAPLFKALVAGASAFEPGAGLFSKLALRSTVQPGTDGSRGNRTIAVLYRALISNCAPGPCVR